MVRSQSLGLVRDYLHDRGVCRWTILGLKVGAPRGARHQQPPGRDTVSALGPDAVKENYVYARAGHRDFGYDTELHKETNALYILVKSPNLYIGITRRGGPQQRPHLLEYPGPTTFRLRDADSGPGNA